MHEKTVPADGERVPPLSVSGDKRLRFYHRFTDEPVMPGSTERIFGRHRFRLPAVRVVASVRASLGESCPCGFLERHVVTSLSASPQQECSDTLPLRNRCTRFPHIASVLYFPCVFHIRPHENSGIPKNTCDGRRFQNKRELTFSLHRRF